ncbi:MAG TPA: type IV pilus twitching motility protein PilT [Gemmatimonadaceae bacterium]|nr:type IV pilus twitching motility protein PilT [Gemmatimonadaceae bacterium]
MPRIDPLLTSLLTNRADSIRLADGDIAHLVKAGTLHPLTRQPLGDGQLLILLREMAPENVAHALGGVEPVEFVYANGEGRFVARVMRENGSLKAVVSPEPAHGNGAQKEVAAHNGAGSSPAAPAAPTPVPPPSSVQAIAQHQPAPPVAAPVVAAPVMPAPVAAPALIRPPVDGAAKADIDSLLKQLVAEGGSDLHLRVGEPPLIRLHGELKRLENRPKLVTAMTEAMLNAIMPDRNYVEFRDTNDSDFAYEIQDVARYRANAFRDHHGAGGVFRVIPSKVATVEDMGITPEVQKLCFLTKGLVLVTGPTGSGKSTTLGALIDLVNRSRSDHVITIEDPIEFVHQNKKCVITQRQVGLHTGSFKHALRAALREDPDVVLIGELRDLETISIAIETAETGHLVFGTLHTTTAVGTIDRVIDQFPADRQEQIRVMLADSLKAVISQTLCKKIGGGRVAAREILLTIPAVSNLIREGKAFQIPSVMQTSRKLGMIQLGDVLIDLVDKGLVEPQEAYMKCTDKASFMVMLKTRGIDLNLSS